VLVVQEGGYNLRNLKSGAAAFFTGFAETIDRRLKKMVVPLGTINPQDPKRNL
jgi:acetoin utilization deacetylase AcuC-like enzyme